MRIDRPYPEMGVDELRAELARVSGSLAAWQFSLADQRKTILVPFLEAYMGSEGRSHAERMKAAEAATVRDQEQILEAEGQVAFATTERDLIVHLLKYRASS
jgi:hypothetical protein